VKANLGHHASGCFSCTYIFSSVLVTGFYTYPEHTPSRTYGTEAEIRRHYVFEALQEINLGGYRYICLAVSTMRHP
jgi:hypothetical protein